MEPPDTPGRFTPSEARSCSKPLRVPVARVVNTRPLSVRVAAGAPWAATVAVKVSMTAAPVTGRWAVQDNSSREWSSSQLRISTSVPSARRQWVKSDCQSSFGWCASKRIIADRGRLLGSGAISCASSRMRRMVETAGAAVPSRSSRATIDAGPASQPAAVSSRRSATTRSRTESVARFGFERGRLERGSSASRPPAS